MGGYPIRKAALIPPSSASVTIQPSSTSVTIPSSSASETTPLSSASTTTRTIPKDLYGFHFDRFVEDKSNFLPQNGHRTIEIEESADGSKLSLTEKEISESEISSWLHQGPGGIGNSRTRVRLLHFSPREDFQSFRPLPVSSDTFEQVFEALRLPRVFLRVLLSNLPFAMRFTPKHDGKSGGSVGLILRTDAFSFAQYSLCLVYDPAAECISGVCIGLRTGEHKQFLLYLKGSLHYATNYMLLPMVFVDFMAHMTARWLTYNRLSLLAIANSKEINVREAQDNRGLRPDLKLDLDTATRKLTFMNDEYSITESISKTQIRFLDLIEEMVGEQQQASGTGSTVWGLLGADAFQEEIAFLRQTFHSALQNIERDRQNIQGLAQTTYCLIAQKESRQNLVIARASSKIADESRKVAIWTRRDSTDMRIITVITMLFLPGTFTATLLGSSFFNFKPAEDSSIVSAWSWLYGVITVILTAAVLVGWFFVSRVQNKKMKKQLGNDNGGTELHSLHAHAITGFWTSRGDSAIWDERTVRAEETGSHESVRGVEAPDTQCGGGCGSGGGCGGGCGSGGGGA